MYNRDNYPKIPPRKPEDKGFIHRLERTVEDTEVRPEQPEPLFYGVAEPQDTLIKAIRGITGGINPAMTLDEFRAAFNLDFELGEEYLGFGEDDVEEDNTYTGAGEEEEQAEEMFEFEEPEEVKEAPREVSEFDMFADLRK